MSPPTRSRTRPLSSRMGTEVAEWRFLRGWSDAELHARLVALEGVGRNFEEAPDALRADDVWRVYRSRAQVGVERPGPPGQGGPFERMRSGVTSYRFSDPDVVKGHFDPDAPLVGRRMLLELKPLMLRYLCGVVVGADREEETAERTLWGYRYETLQGHIETGAEWFLLEKDHRTGVVTFRIEAHWKPGQFPNWWSRLGFRFLAPYYQRRWHRAAQRRLAAIGAGAVPLEPTRTSGPGGTLEHEGVRLGMAGRGNRTQEGA